MVEIQEGLLKEDRTFVVNGKEYHNSKLYAKDGYHFYDVKEYEENLKFAEENKDNDFNIEKNYITFAITPLINGEDINLQYKSEKIEKVEVENGTI